MPKSILCQIDPRGRLQKPETLQEYGKLRDYMIQRPWESLSDGAFIELVTKKGCTFYGCLFKGLDLVELQYQRLCWHTQTLIGVDFDKCQVNPEKMVKLYTELGYKPWLAYRTFSDGQHLGKSSYRLLWKVDVNLNVSYETTHGFIKALAALAGKGVADKHSMDPSRMWQGSRKGYVHYDPEAPLLDLRGQPVPKTSKTSDIQNNCENRCNVRAI